MREILIRHSHIGTGHTLDQLDPKTNRVAVSSTYPTKERADEVIASYRRAGNVVIEQEANYHEYACGCKEATSEKSKYYDHQCAQCYVFATGTGRRQGAWKK